MRRSRPFTRPICGRGVCLVVLVVLGAGPALCAVLQDAARAPASQADAAPVDGGIYGAARACLIAGDVAGAAELLAGVQAADPTQLAALRGMARACAAAGHGAEALACLDQLGARQPGAAAVAMVRAELLALRADWERVTELLGPLEAQLDAPALVLLARGWAQRKQPARATAVLERGLGRHPESEALWLALIDQALEARQEALALRRIDRAERELGPSPQLDLRAAQAYCQLGQPLGQTAVRRVPGGRIGQFAGDWLLLEQRGAPDEFLCCPRQSALYAVRRALDAGVDEPAAHLLHARIWQQAGRPAAGLTILRARETVLLEQAPSEALALLAELALAAGALPDFLRYTQLQAAREPQRRAQLLYDAYVAAAERYSQRGEEALHRELLRRALELRSEDPALMLVLADALWESGARAEAGLWYRRVLEREPAHPQRRRILERLAD